MGLSVQGKLTTTQALQARESIGASELIKGAATQTATPGATFERLAESPYHLTQAPSKTDTSPSELRAQAAKLRATKNEANIKIAERLEKLADQKEAGATETVDGKPGYKIIKLKDGSEVLVDPRNKPVGYEVPTYGQSFTVTEGAPTVSLEVVSRPSVNGSGVKKAYNPSDRVHQGALNNSKDSLIANINKLTSVIKQMNDAELAPEVNLQVQANAQVALENIFQELTEEQANHADFTKFLDALGLTHENFADAEDKDGIQTQFQFKKEILNREIGKFLANPTGYKAPTDADGNKLFDRVSIPEAPEAPADDEKAVPPKPESRDT